MKKLVDYRALFNKAMRNVVKSAIETVLGSDLKYSILLKFSLLTSGSYVPHNLIKQNQTDFTISIKPDQFGKYDLKSDSFLIELQFQNDIYNIKIPYNSIISFIDQDSNIMIDIDPVISKQHYD